MTDTEIRALRQRAEVEYPFAGERVVRLCDELLEARRLLRVMLTAREYPGYRDWPTDEDLDVARTFVKEPTP